MPRTAENKTKAINEAKILFLPQTVKNCKISSPLAKPDPIKVASLPVEEEGTYEDLNDKQRNDTTEEKAVPTDEERGEIFIPETNNDIFSGTTIF